MEPRDNSPPSPDRLHPDTACADFKPLGAPAQVPQGRCRLPSGLIRRVGAGVVGNIPPPLSSTPMHFKVDSAMRKTLHSAARHHRRRCILPCISYRMPSSAARKSVLGTQVRRSTNHAVVRKDKHGCCGL